MKIRVCRHWVKASIVLLAVLVPAVRSAQEPMTFDRLVETARTVAAKPYRHPAEKVPAMLLAPKLTYDQYRDIRFRTEQALWRNLRLGGMPLLKSFYSGKMLFEAQFFHPGFVANNTVELNEVTDQASFPIKYRKDFFDFGKNRFDRPLPDNMGFSGFRLHYPLNNEAYFDELAVFQGASYFRLLGAGQTYGMSARGLAINSCLPGQAEEFPIFSRFWLVRPAFGTREMTVYALMDGALVNGQLTDQPSVVGAYQFIIRPGTETLVDVRARLFFRRTPGEIGLAPMTSMYWYGKTESDHLGDFRPEVHDSDGLQLHVGNGERLWRPLNNQTFTRNSSFFDTNPRGFGLLQRERSFHCYEDLEANYHLRPSVWVEPVGNWGRGSVRLAELYAVDETVDNIAAFWVPEKAPKVGEELEFAYRLNWFVEAKKHAPPAGRVVATHYSEFVLGQPDQRLFILDFESPALAALPADAKVEPLVTIGAGAELVHAYACKNPHNSTWRVGMTLRLTPETLRAVENHEVVAQMNHTLAMTDRFTAPLRGTAGRENVIKGAESFAASTVQYRTAILPAGDHPTIELRCFLRTEKEALSETWSYRWNP